MKKFFLFLLLCFMTQNTLQGQKKLKWGKVPKEHLEMTEYAANPDASAIILNKQGSFDVSLEGKTTYRYHTRIKILSAEGLDRANVELFYLTKTDKVNGLKAQTITPVSNGQTQITKITKNDIFDENYDKNYNVKKFTLPNVQVGSIIEYSYVNTSDRIFNLKPWYMQTDIPILQTSYDGILPVYLDYIVINQNQKIVRMEETQDSQSKFYTWTAENVPALVEEDYITTMKDYYARALFQLEAYRAPGKVPQFFMSSWQQLSDDLAIDSKFNKIEGTKKVKNIAKEITANTNDLAEKTQIIYNYVAQNIKWNGYYSFVTFDSFNSILGNHTANSAGINLMLLNMLEAVDIEANPVLISTRKHGKTFEAYPFINQFNHTIVEVTIGEGSILLDAIDEFRPPNLLPLNDLNVRGLKILKKGPPQWINIVSKKGINRTISLEGKLSEDGLLKAKVDCSDKDYSAYTVRKKLNDKENKEYVEDLLSDVNDITIDSCKIANRNKLNKPVKTSFEVVTKEYSNALNDYIYFSPMTFEGLAESPLTLKKRAYDIDFGHPISKTYILNIEIPEGYQIEELPAPAKVVLGEKWCNFTFQAQKNGENKIQLMSKMKINFAKFTPETYPDLKEFFNLIVEKHAEQIVLVKSK